MQVALPFRIAVPAWVMVLLLALVLGAFGAKPAAATLLISVNKSTQSMAVSLNGRPMWVWPVSTGRRGHDTPAGKFTPFRLERDHFSKEWDDAPMPHSIFFSQAGHAIHGTTDQKRLGQRASHGCIRLSQAHAARLFELVSQHGLGNTRVVVFSHSPDTPAPEVAGQPPAPAFGMATEPPQPADASAPPAAPSLNSFSTPTSGQ